MIHVTDHAIERYRERVADVPEDEARLVLSSQVVNEAAEFGARFVRLGTGQRIVLEGSSVVTVLGSRQKPRELCRRREGS